MITEQISEMQIELETLRTERETLRIDNAVLLTENQSLRHQLNKERALKEQWMLRCTEVQTLVQQTSIALVHGITRIKELKKASQEAELDVGDDSDRPSPEFLKDRVPERRQPIEDTGKKVMFPTPQDSKPFRFGGAVRPDIDDDRLPRAAL